MAAVTPRILHTNRAVSSATVITTSSTDQAFAESWLRDQIRSRRWRSKLGWTVVAGVNDKINFNRGGVKTATLTAGTYATGALFAAAIMAALEAADATPVWAVTYSGSTFKFTIASDVAFVLLFGTGADLATSAGPDMGYAASDTASATSHMAGSAAYQSRQWLKFDLGSALTVSAGIVLSHNVSSGGTVRVQGNATDAWTSPTVNELLSTSLAETVADPVGRLASFAEATLRYWRILLSDVSNPDGYTEVGVVYVGPQLALSHGYSSALRKRRTDLSLITKAVRGAHYQSLRPTQRVWSLEWIHRPDAERIVLEAALDQTPKGKNFFFCFDSANMTDTVYVYAEQDVEVAVSSGLLWRVTIEIAEAMP